jgi:hypothetical protein
MPLLQGRRGLFSASPTSSIAWTRRDTLHFLCRECGAVQTYFSHLPMAG